MASILLAGALGAWAGCAGPSPGRNVGAINETLLVELPAGRIAAFARDLRTEVREHHIDGHIGLNTGYQQPIVRETPAAAFSGALDDARRKAAAIAAHEGLPLGPICVVSEVSGGGVVAQALKGVHDMVRVDANGPAAVVVDYSFGGSCKAKDRGDIVVAGFAAAAPAAIPRPNEIQGIALRLETGGTDGAGVERSLTALEAAVRTVVKRYGANARYVGVENETQY